MRTSDISRVTAETDIRLSLVLDGSGVSDVDTGVAVWQTDEDAAIRRIELPEERGEMK